MSGVGLMTALCSVSLCSVGHRLLATIIDQVITDTFGGAEAAAAAAGKLQTLPHAFLQSVFRMHKTRSCKAEGLIIVTM